MTIHYDIRLSRLLAVPRYFNKLAGISVTLLTGLLLAGCAAQLAYRDGRDLIAQDKVEQGLVKYQEAMAADPGNLQYQAAYRQTRDRATTAYLHQASLLTDAGRTAEAETLYQRVLGIDPGNDRARQGLAALLNSRRHAQWFKEAQAAAERNDVGTAQNKLASLLAENPNYPGAATLQRNLAEKAARPLVEASLAAAYKKPISIEFRDAQLKQVFQVISMSSGLNFVFDKDVKTDQKTSIFLKNSTTETAIYTVLMTNQLDQHILDNNTILIYPNIPAKQKEYQELVVKSFFLTNADAKTVANTVKTIVKSRDIVIDEKLNMIIVRDSADAIKLVDKLVALHDSPEPEVMLEVEILEVKRSRLMELGVQWPSNFSMTLLPSSGGTLTARDLRNNVNSGTIGVGISPVVVNARKLDGDTNLLANPRIRARNREKAKILIGERVPNITTTLGAGASAFVSESINYVDVGLKLEVEPTVHLDNDVAIRVNLEVSNIVNQLQTKSGSIAYQIGTRNASTVLRLKDGENQILAGLINDDDRKSANKVPGLGELPIVGRLFGSTLDDNQKTEIVLSITPHLIRNIQRPAAVLSEFRSGTDTSFRGAPDTAVKAPAKTASAPAASATPAQSGASTSPSSSSPDAGSGTAPAPAAGGASGSASTPAPSSTVTPGTAPASSSTPSPGPATVDNPGAVPQFGAVAVPSGVSNQTMSLQWMGRTQWKLGEPIDLELVMQSKDAVSGVSMVIAYDPRVLQPTNVTESDFLKSGGVRTTFTSDINSPGQIQIKAARVGDAAGKGATGAGALARLGFRPIAPSDATQVKIQTIAPVDAGGQPVVPPSTEPHVMRIQP